MKRAKLLILVLSVCHVLHCTGSVQAIAMPANESSNGKLSIPSKFKVSASFEKKKYFLGENALLQYSCENNGTTAFAISTGGDYRGSPRSTRFNVTAMSADGTVVVDPHPNPMCMGGLGGQQTLNSTDRFCQSLPLMEYCEIRKPGIYTVTVSHDLGWKENSNKLVSATAQVEFVMPTAQEALVVLNSLFALSDGQVIIHGKPTSEIKDFSTLAFPVYLPLLLQIVQNGSSAGKIAHALTGIGSIPSPDATKALIDLAGNKDPEVAKQALELLLMRLPDPQLRGELPPRGAFENSMPDERRRLAKESWDAKFAPDVRALGLKLITSTDKEQQAKAVFLFECVGDATCMHAFMDALDGAIKASETLPLEQYVYPRPRGNVAEFMRAASCMLKTDSVSKQPQTAAESAMYMLAISKDNEFRPADWSSQYQNFLHSKTAFLRELACKTMPTPLPPVLESDVAAALKDGDIDVQIAACDLAGKDKKPIFLEPLKQAVRKAHEDFSLNQAVNALFGYDQFACLQILASRLGESKDMNSKVLTSLISGTIDYSSYGSRSSSGGPSIELEADDGKLKTAWVKFLNEYKDPFSKGVRMKIPDVRITANLLPASMCFYLSDGKEWPSLSKDQGSKIAFSDPKIQLLLVNQVRDALPKNWKVTGQHAGVIPADWASNDSTAGFLVEAASGSEIAKICFLPVDWTGIITSTEGARRAWNEGEILVTGSFKLVIQLHCTKQYETMQQLRRIGSGSTASLINSGADMAKKIFGNKPEEIDKKLQLLLSEHCKTPAQLDAAAMSLIMLGVPARSIYLRAANELRNEHTDLFISAMSYVGGKEAAPILLKIFSDPTATDHVRTRALDVLRQLDMLGDPKLGSLMVTALKQMKSEEEMGKVCTALTQSGYQPAAQAILETFRRIDNLYFKANLADKLAALKAHEALPELQNLENKLKAIPGSGKAGNVNLAQWQVTELIQKVHSAIVRLENSK